MSKYMFSDHQIVQYYTLKSLEQDRPNLVLWKISVWDRFYLADQTLENTVTTGTIEEFWLSSHRIELGHTLPPDNDAIIPMLFTPVDNCMHFS